MRWRDRWESWGLRWKQNCGMVCGIGCCSEGGRRKRERGGFVSGFDRYVDPGDGVGFYIFGLWVGW